MKQEMRLEFESISSNESFARVVVAAFLTRLNPTIEEVADVKTAVSEAVTNAIIHGYENAVHKIVIWASIENNVFTVAVQDFGVGIPDISKAMSPMFTTRGDLERSGMGFVFMEAFMDGIEVQSVPGEGTCVTMTKIIGNRKDAQE